jgi:hypothetical protein
MAKIRLPKPSIIVAAVELLLRQEFNDTTMRRVHKLNQPLALLGLIRSGGFLCTKASYSVRAAWNAKLEFKGNGFYRRFTKDRYQSDSGCRCYSITRQRVTNYKSENALFFVAWLARFFTPGRRQTLLPRTIQGTGAQHRQRQPSGSAGPTS